MKLNARKGRGRRKEREEEKIEGKMESNDRSW